jgi:hypothetical protein
MIVPLRLQIALFFAILSYFYLIQRRTLTCLCRSYSGLAVLEVIRNEKLVCSAKMVGRFLQQQLTSLKER